MAEEKGGLHITAGAFFQHGLGYSVTWEKMPEGDIRTHGWIIGYDTWSTYPPCALLEGSILHALRQTERLLDERKEPYPKYVEILAGNQQTLDALLKWANKGTIKLTSSMASDIIAYLYKLASKLKCTLILRDLPEDFFNGATLTGARSNDIIYATAARINKFLRPLIWDRWGERISRIPWTETETKQLLKKTYAEDEKTAILLLRDAGSTACSIYSEMRLSRDIVKSIFKELRYSRFQQVTLAGIICATRFKFFEGDQKFPVKCVVSPNCNEIDSFPHLLKCTKLSIPPESEGEEALMRFLVRMVERATVGNPGFPDPIRSVMDGEIEINLPPSPIRSEGEISFDE